MFICTDFVSSSAPIKSIRMIQNPPLTRVLYHVLPYYNFHLKGIWKHCHLTLRPMLSSCTWHSSTAFLRYFFQTSNSLFRPWHGQKCNGDGRRKIIGENCGTTNYMSERGLEGTWSVEISLLYFLHSKKRQKLLASWKIQSFFSFPYASLCVQ